jgi:hypothetical protein
MRNKFLKALLITTALFASAAYADVPGPPAGTLDPSSGAPGVVTPDNGMEPNPSPLAPNMPLTPSSSSYPQQPISDGSTQQTVIITPVISPADDMDTASENETKPVAPEVLENNPTPPPYVAGPASSPVDNPMMEKCKVLDKDGNGLIKAYMADSGPNLEGDAGAWIWVPRGQCTKINHGDFSGVSAMIRAKINPSDITNAQTIE